MRRLPMSCKTVTPFGFEELPGAVPEPLDKRVLALRDRGVIKAKLSATMPKSAPCRMVFEHLGPAQPGLGRDAAPIASPRLSHERGAVAPRL